MFFYFPAFFYALAFLAGLEIIIYQPALAFYALAVLILASLWKSKKIGKRWLFSIIPTVFSISSIILLYFIDIFAEKQLFVFLSAFIYYLSLLSAYRLRNYSKDQTAMGLIMASATATIFFFYAASYGIHLNFAVPLWVLILAYFLVTFLVSYQYFKIIKNDNEKSAFIYSTLLGMVMAEIAWMISFWPFGYLTTGATALIFYYTLWDLIRSHFLNFLSKKRVIANMILSGFLIGFLLISSKWLPNI
ncbi:hypothetical protein J7J13_03770 [bacterium]|nr:hypothetical protein [bacterium]